VQIHAIVGGISKEKQTRILGYRPEILIATPGRLDDLMRNELHPYLQYLN